MKQKDLVVPPIVYTERFSCENGISVITSLEDHDLNCRDLVVPRKLLKSDAGLKEVGGV